MNLSSEIIKEWNLGSLPEDKRVLAINRISRLVLQALMVRSLDILSSEEQTELDDLMNEDSTTSEDILLFLKSKIPTFNALVREERNNLRSSLFV